METEGWSCRAVRTDDVSHSIILQTEEKYIHLKTNQCLNYIFCHIWLLKVELLTADQPVTVRRTNPLTAVITLIAAPLIALCEPLKCKQITDSPFCKAEVDSAQSLRYRSEVLKMTPSHLPPYLHTWLTRCKWIKLQDSKPAVLPAVTACLIFFTTS